MPNRRLTSRWSRTLDRSFPCAAAPVGRRQVPLTSALGGLENISNRRLEMMHFFEGRRTGPAKPKQVDFFTSTMRSPIGVLLNNVVPQLGAGAPNAD